MRKGFLDRRFIQPIVRLLTQGVTPEKIALSLALGLVIGVFPVLGSTTILCAIAAVLLRLNLPAIQLVNLFAYPLQFIFLLPFIRMGEFLFRARPLRLSLEQMLAMAHADLPHAIATLWVTALRAVSAWLLLCPALILVSYSLFLLIVRRIVPFAAPLFTAAQER